VFKKSNRTFNTSHFINLNTNACLVKEGRAKLIEDPLVQVSDTTMLIGVPMPVNKKFLIAQAFKRVIKNRI
jgi:hypothetical protein